MKLWKMRVIGLCVILLVGIGEVRSASVFLEWNFNEGTLGSLSDWTGIGDVSGNGRYGYALPGNGTMDLVASPLANSSSGNYAVRFNSFHKSSVLAGGQQYSITSGTPSSGFALPTTTFSTGVSSRIVVNIDSPVSWSDSDYYQYLCRYRLVNGESLFGLKQDVCYGGFTGQVYTTNGVQTVGVSQSAIESQLGYGIIGKPVVLTMTWSAANNLLSLYADGQLVGSQATTGTLALDVGKFLVGNENVNVAWSRISTYDEVKVWDGALSADQVLADYRALVPEPASLSLLCLGLMSMLRRRNSAF